MLGAVSAALGMAQERSGSFSGRVTDPAGDQIPGASVTVTSPALIGASARTETDGGGGYLFASLPPGVYTVTIRQRGFVTFKRSDIAVAVGRNLRLDAGLEVGSISESIIVSGESIAVDTATAIVATNLTADLYDRLPKGRSFDGLVVVAPGVRFEPKSGGYQADGASGSENSYVVNGVEVTNIQTGTLDRQARLPIEWIAETQVKNSGVDAQYGGAIGAVVNAITRSGGNDFHGQVSFYFGSDALNAGPRPTLRLNPDNDRMAGYYPNRRDGSRGLNPGFRLGGPVLRNRLWFFLSAYPQFDKTSRTVTFLSNRETREYTSRERQDFSTARLDYAPAKRVRLNLAYVYNPYKQNGMLPGRDGTDAFSNPWADRGKRMPAASYNWQGDWTASRKLSFSLFGGHSYTNYKDYGIPDGTRYRFMNSNRGLPGLPIPAGLEGSAGNFTPDNVRTLRDIYTRDNVNANGSLLGYWHGDHSLRFGYQLNRLANRPIANAWPDGNIQIYWDRAYNAITRPGSFRGPYGYYINRVMLTEGDVSSNNVSLFLQDTWRMSRKLTLSLGLRAEREFLPSFATGGGIPSRPIQFGFGQKLAPRLGFAFDPSGQGRMKIHGSFGFYYDLMKYEMPRGSFGGDRWKDYYYTLDDPNFFNIQPKAGNPADCRCPGTLIEVLDRRIPANDPSKNLIDPNLKPVRQRALDLGYEYSFARDWVSGVRYTRKRLDRTIEDVGLLTPQGEQYFITNPGFGLSVDPTRFPAGYPNPANPKAKRDYDAVEFRLERRFSREYLLMASYTWSRLYGNYGGLASSDEAMTKYDGTPEGRTSPNISRYFDEAWMNYDQSGRLVYGRLGTDRPHTFKFFGSFDRRWLGGTTHLGPQFFAFSGTPITTEFNVQDVPVFINGRGDLGRTPFFTQTDFAIQHDIRAGGHEGRYFRIELNVRNLFNQSTVIDRFKTESHANDGALTFANTADIFKGYDALKLAQNPLQPVRIDPRYNLASAFQLPRELRFGFHFIF